jgi:putative transcriptional regulator
VKSIPKRLTGRLLVAKPDLLDPNFLQSIVFVARHGKEGALGFILNRPLGVSLAEMAAPKEYVQPYFKRVPVFSGGPVGGGRLAVVVFKEVAKRRAVRAMLGVPVDRIERYVDKPGSWVLAFHGYSGWDAGQLERELLDDSWDVREMDPVVFDSRFIKGLWPFLIAKDDRWRVMMDYIPRDVERN